MPLPPPPGPGGGTVDSVTSTDATLLSVTSPTGPHVSLTPHSGGGGLTAKRAQISPTNLVTIANGSSTNLTFTAAVTDPTAILTRTGATQLTVTAAGLYVMTFSVRCSTAMTAGGTFIIRLITSATYTVFQACPAVPAGTAGQYVAGITGTAYLAATATIQVLVTNLDGVAARAFYIDFTNTVQLIA